MNYSAVVSCQHQSFKKVIQMSCWKISPMLHLLASIFRPMIICGALRDLVPFAQFKKREKHRWRSVILVTCRLKPATLLKLTLLYRCSSRFLNCTMHHMYYRWTPSKTFQWEHFETFRKFFIINCINPPLLTRSKTSKPIGNYEISRNDSCLVVLLDKFS